MTSPAEIPLAIIGMGCRVPGADDLDAYWRLLIEGRTVLGELPPDRLDRSLYYHPEKGRRTKTYTTLGGVVEHRPFDFSRCPHPGELYDRGHKVHHNLCEVAAAAARDAGFDPFQMPRLATGVYVGHTPPSSIVSRLIHARLSAHTTRYLLEVPGFAELLGDQSEETIEEIVGILRREFPDGHPALSLNCNAYHGSGIISQTLRLDGPSMAFDAACASSMRALAAAARALQLGQIDMALVGAASYCHTDTLVLFSAAQSLTAKFSRPFDNDADGLIASEAYACVLVKTLERALVDGDRIQAIIRGIGISSDGKGKSLWAPRREGQIEAVRRAYPKGLSPASLQYIEAHATSTQLGDATELGALHTAIGGELPAGQKLIVGSVKGNIGHSLETAGLASIIKTVLAMRNGTIPPQCGLKTLNTDVAWNEVPFVIPRQATPWPSPAVGEPKRAAVNAFGIGGLNVHVILEEPSAERGRSLVRAIPGPKQGAAVRVMEEGPLPLKEPIAIVGRGAVLPGARTVDALWDLFSSGRDMRSEAPDDRWLGAGPDRGIGTGEHWKTPHRIGGFINDFVYDWKRHKVPPKQVQSADPLQFMLLDATEQALKDAGYEAKPLDRMRTGVVVGTIFGGEFADQLQMGLRLPEFQRTLKETLARRGVATEERERISEEFEKTLLKHLPALIDETGSFTASTLASRLTKTFDLMGGAVAVDAGEVSAFAALSNCIDLLLAGDCDVMICASGQRNMGYAWFLSMQGNHILSPNAPTAPFDARSSGEAPGEGVGVVVLKRLSDAVRDGDRVHGVIRGIGAANYGLELQDVSQAMRRSLRSASIAADQVTLLEAGSGGIPKFDRQEWAAIHEVYDSPDRAQPLLVGAVAGQLGHQGGASGMVSLLKGITELAHLEMPANVGLTAVVKGGEPASPNIQAAIQPCALRGINADGLLYGAISGYSTCSGAYQLIVEGATRVPAEVRPPTRTTAAARVSVSAAARSVALTDGARAIRIARFSAFSLDGLIERLTAGATSAESVYSTAAGVDEISATSPFSTSDRFRVAIVSRSAEELAESCALAVKQLPKAESRGALAEKGIFFSERTAVRRRVAFLFPGQGSQYGGMLKSLVESYAPAAESMRRVDESLKRLSLPTFAEIAWQQTERLGADVWLTQLALLAADRIVFESATAMGLRPERVAGHSFGELAALTAAGSWSFEEAVRATKHRCDSIESCQNAKGALLSTTATSDAADAVCREIHRDAQGRRLYVSHYNAPDQTVVGGDPEAIQQAAEKLTSLGYRTKILDVPAAFHTPLMEEVKRPFGAALATVSVEPPRIPLLSSVTVRYAAEPAEIRDNLVVQMTQPVPWVELVRRLEGEGLNVLVEVGPKQVLTGLQKQILQGKDAAIVGCDHPKRDGLLQLAYARACVEVSGALDADASAETQPSASTQETSAVAAGAPKSVPQDAASNADVESAPAVGTIERQGECRILRVAGSPFDMGRQHGAAEAESIRRVLRRYADLAGTRWDTTPQIEAALAQPEIVFTPEGLQELEGMAEGADVSLPALLAYNLRLQLDLGAGGLHFAVRRNANGDYGLLHAANEELHQALFLRDCLERHVQIRQPSVGRPHLAFCVAGQIGTLNGINAAGLTLTTTALVDVAQTQEAPQLLHSLLVRKILTEAETIDASIAILRNHRSGGAWTICMSHHASDRLCYVEFDGRELKVQPSADQVVAVNHRLMKTFAAAEESQKGTAPQHSRHRMDRLRELLGGGSIAPLSPEKAQSTLRDRFDRSRRRETAYPTQDTVRRVDNQISVVMQPGLDQIWVTGGPLSNGHANEFQRLQLSQLLPLTAAPDSAQSPSGDDAKEPAPIHGCRIDAKEVGPLYQQAAAARSATPDICTRLVLRVVDAPRGPGQSAAGPVTVLGRNAAADAVRSRLGAAGVALQEIDGKEDLSPAPHLIVMTAFDEAAKGHGVDRRNAGVTEPFFQVQKWYQRVSDAGLLNSARLMVATTLGGDFGLCSRFHAVEGGALSGLAKGIEMEVRLSRGAPDFRSKIVDFEANATSDAAANAVVSEWRHWDAEQEVGYLGDRRVTVRPVPVSVPAHSGFVPARGDVFVVTGGARGVTAAVARELGRRFGVRMHLLGASPAPEIPDAWRNLGDSELKEVKATIMKEALANGQKPADAWSRFEKGLEIDRTLQEFAAEGIEAVYHSCDVGRRQDVDAVLQRIRSTSGPIVGVIHGAGFERACRFEKKQPELVERTLASKVDGASNLMSATANDPVKWFVAFGSVAGRFGGVGQTDYCVANEMLAKRVDRFRGERPNRRAAVFHWHAWDDVGMAVRPESQHIRKLHNIKFMPAAEGVRHLVDELLAGLPEPEVAITELDYCLQRYGQSMAVSEASANERVADAERTPLVDRVTVVEDGRRLITEIDLDPAADVFLTQHLFKGRPMMPVVASIEAMVEAAERFAGPGEKVVAVHDLEILTGLRFINDSPQVARVHAERDGALVACRLTSDLTNRRGQVLQKDRPYLSARIKLGTLEPLAASAPAQVTGEWNPVWYPEADTVIWHGQPLRRLQEMAVINDQVSSGRLIAPDPNELSGGRRSGGWTTPAALLDSCLYACGVIFWYRHRGVVAIPNGIQSVRFGTMPQAGESCLAIIEERGRQDATAMFDFTLYRADGTVACQVEGYRNVIVAEEPAYAR